MSSTKFWNKTQDFYGIFSNNPKESPMYDANKAILISCSSDLYMGGGGHGVPDSTNFKFPNSTNKTFKFRGQRLVEAFIKDLISRQGLGY